MANEKVIFSKGTSNNLPEDHIPGRLLVATDTGNVYLDTTESTRVQMTDTRKLNTDGTTTMSGNLNMGGYSITNIADPNNTNDASNKKYVDSQISTTKSEISTQLNNYLQLSGGVMSGNIDMSNHKISNLPDPSSSSDAVNKSYVDTSIGMITSFKVDSNGGSGYASLEALKEAHPTGESGIFYLIKNSSATSPNEFDEYFWTGVSYEKAGGFGDIDTGELATKQDLSKYLPLTGGTLTGVVNYSSVPTSDTNLVNKKYVDSAITSSTGSSNYIFTATFDGTKISATPINTTETINWKPGDTAFISIDTDQSTSPLYYGTFLFQIGDTSIPISTVSMPHGSSDMYIQQSTLTAVYATIQEESALMVMSTDNVIHIDSSNSGLEINKSENTGIANSIGHKKLPQVARIGPNVTGGSIKLSYGGGFEVPSVGYDKNGHLVFGDETTFILPAAPESTDINVEQSESVANKDFRLLLSHSDNNITETASVYKSGTLLFNPSTGILSAPKFDGIMDDGVIT